ncbi:MAG: phospholipase D-like domain-containing protein, partial [Candidatus Hodarchaeales archaeon]
MKFTRIKITSGVLAVLTVILVTISLFSISSYGRTVNIEDQHIIPSLKYTPRFDAFNVEEEMTLTPIFTPDNAEDVISAWIDKANDTIDIQNPYFTMYDSSDWASDSHPIVRALVDAYGRGVTIRVQINEGSDSDDITSYFDSVGIAVRYMGSSISNPDDEYLTDTHNKLVIIDNKVAITSSINFSENAFANNREAGMVIQSSSVAAHFTAVFVSDWEDG